VISALTHISRLARAGFVFAREGVFGVVDPALVPPPGQLKSSSHPLKALVPPTQTCLVALAL